MGDLKIEEIHKEIDLIQGCITRMNTCSFYVKGWYISLTAVIIALENAKLDKPLISLIFALTIVFSFLDARYLAYERRFRKLYKSNLEKRKANNYDGLYELDIKKRCKREWNDFFSWESTVFYGIPLLICIILFFAL